MTDATLDFEKALDFLEEYLENNSDNASAWARITLFYYMDWNCYVLYILKGNRTDREKMVVTDLTNREAFGVDLARATEGIIQRKLQMLGFDFNNFADVSAQLENIIELDETAEKLMVEVLSSNDPVYYESSDGEYLVEITRAEVEQAIDSIVKRMVDKVKEFCCLPEDEPDTIVLAGKYSQIPLIHNHLEKAFPKVGKGNIIYPDKDHDSVCSVKKEQTSIKTSTSNCFSISESVPSSKTRIDETIGEYSDRILVCRDCGNEFTFTAAEQQFFAEKGFSTAPTRCHDCRQAKRRAQNPEVKYYETICDGCGATTLVPFQPMGDRPIYCRICFERHRSQF